MAAHCSRGAEKTKLAQLLHAVEDAQVVGYRHYAPVLGDVGEGQLGVVQALGELAVAQGVDRHAGHFQAADGVVGAEGTVGGDGAVGRGGVDVALGPVGGDVGEGLAGDGDRLPAENAAQHGDKGGAGHILAHAEAAVGVALHESVGPGTGNNGRGPGIFRVGVATGHGGEGTGQKRGHEQGDEAAFEVQNGGLLSGGCRYNLQHYNRNPAERQ